jgi:hypothetical protein
MRVRVTATNADGPNAAQSAQTAKVAAATSSAAPKNTARPTITGTPKVGQTLTADPRLLERESAHAIELARSRCVTGLLAGGVALRS